MTTAIEHEEYVRRRWERAEACEDAHTNWCISLGGRGYTRANVPIREVPTEAQAWSAAYAFTLEREEQIRQVEEEIAVIGADISESWDCLPAQTAYLRIEARLKEVLAELKKGLKA